MGSWLGAGNGRHLGCHLNPSSDLEARTAPDEARENAHRLYPKRVIVLLDRFGHNILQHLSLERLGPGPPQPVKNTPACG